MLRPASANTTANVCNAKIVRMMSADWRLGRSSGSTTWTVRRKRVAPKRSAASKKSRGISCSPAIRMSRTMAVARQDSAITIALRIPGTFSNERKMIGCWITPALWSALFRYPRSVKTASQRMPAARSEIASGIA